MNIDLTQQDFLEETLLKMAGITNQPQKCQYNCTNVNFMTLSITGISAQESNQFLAFLRKVLKDDNSVSVSTTAEYTQTFNIDTAKALEFLLPAFAAEVARLEKESPATIEKYKSKEPAKRNPFAFHKLPTEDDKVATYSGFGFNGPVQ